MVHMIDGGFEGEKKRKQSIIKLDLTFLTQANYCTIVYYKNYFQNNSHLFILARLHHHILKAFNDEFSPLRTKSVPVWEIQLFPC